MNVPFLDLKAQYASIRDEVGEALQNVLDNTAFASGPFVAKFEKEYAEFCDSEFAIGVGSGTSALWLTLLALGIGYGDEVITASDSFIATAEAISFCGATPVFVDVEEETYNLNPELIKAAITPRTKAIIPVHLFGQPANMDPIIAVAKKHKLLVIEDACQAHGAEYKGRRTGSLGLAGCFSFYPGKNLGAYGEGGIITTSNKELNDRIRMLRDHGQSQKYYHEIVGWNDRMDGFQGAILSVKLKYLMEWNEKRRSHAKRYSVQLAQLSDVITPVEAKHARHIYHVYAIRTERRDELMNFLKENEIYCGIHYPVPIHLQNAYKSLGYKPGSLPVTEKCANEFLSLPMFPELKDSQIDFIVDAIKRFFSK